MEEHVRSLRAHINEYDNKFADLTVEQHRQQTALRSKEKELQSLEEEAKRLRSETEELERKGEHVRELISKGKQTIASLETNSAALVQAFELLKLEIANRAASLSKKKNEYEECSRALNAKKQRLQTDYESLELVRKIKEVDGQPPTQIRPEVFSVTSQNDEQAEPGIEGAAHKYWEEELRNLEMSCQIIRSKVEEEENVVNELLNKCGEIQNIKDFDLPDLEEALKVVQEDKVQEEEYIRSLQLRLDHLKAIQQEVNCTCGLTYTVKLEDTAV